MRVPVPRTPNSTELRYNVERLGGMGLYEGITFHVPSGRYTPDWVYFAHGQTVCIEVKGGYRLGSQSGASAKFKEAVALFPGITFVWAKLEKDGTWNVETIPPRPPLVPRPRPCARPRPIPAHVPRGTTTDGTPSPTR